MSKKSNESFNWDQVINAGERIVAALKEIAICGEILLSSARDIKAVISTNELAINKIEAKPTVNPAAIEADSTKPEKTYTKEDVRAILAEKSSAGYRTEVKALLGKYGAAQLKEVDPASYTFLMEEAQVIGNE